MKNNHIPSPKTEIQSVAILGSGASAIAVASQLLSTSPNIHIDVIDVGRTFESKRNDIENLSTTGDKSYFGSLFSYDRIGIDTKSLEKPIWPSHGFGGFTRIWGAAIHNNDEMFEQFNLQLGHGGTADSLMTKSGEKLSKRIQEKREVLFKNGWIIGPHNLAVDPAKCISCGTCLTGCPTNAIWFAGDAWESFPSVNFVLGQKVIRLNQIEDQVYVFLEKAAKPMYYDRVFVALGPIATSILLINSELLPRKVAFKDSQTIFVPLLRWRVNEENRSFSLSQISSSFTSPDTKKIHVQFYPDSRHLSHVIRRFFPINQRFASAIWRFLSPYFMGAIVYLEPEISQELHLEKRLDTYYLSSENNTDKTRAAKRAISRFCKELRILNVLPVRRLIDYGGAGEGYHFGSVSDLEIDTATGALNKANRVHIVDAAALTSIPVGPITLAVMLNAQKLVANSLRNIR
jgi:ferredoxin